jgi:hypothetical protein
LNQQNCGMLYQQKHISTKLREAGKKRLHLRRLIPFMHFAVMFWKVRKNIQNTMAAYENLWFTLFWTQNFLISDTIFIFLTLRKKTHVYLFCPSVCVVYSYFRKKCEGQFTLLRLIPWRTVLDHMKIGSIRLYKKFPKCYGTGNLLVCPESRATGKHLDQYYQHNTFRHNLVKISYINTPPYGYICKMFHVGNLIYHIISVNFTDDRFKIF